MDEAAPVLELKVTQHIGDVTVFEESPRDARFHSLDPVFGYA